ncbi:MAG: helix-turn-helix domain-containing protein, partial [Pseudobdellovibrionaceae bacterium]
TAQFISNWERGISHPPMSTIKILSKLYGVPVESFYNAALEDELAEVRKKLHAKYFGNKKTSKKTLEDEHLKSQTDNI